MLYKHVKALGLALAILGLTSTLAFAQDSDTVPGSRGVVVTITSIDAKTGMAILKTEAGEAFELWKERLWKVGDKLLCDWRDGVPPRLWLQRCQLWK